VLYFEASQAVIRSLNKEAFYRLSVWSGKDKIADMIEGLSPVILANKIFLSKASINFALASRQVTPEVVLWYYFKEDEHVLGKAHLDLTEINQKFTQSKERMASHQSLGFKLEEGEVKMFFNIFVERSKISLDAFVRKFKEDEQEGNRLRRIESNKEKKLSS
jgi:hypothetical protein